MNKLFVDEIIVYFAGRNPSIVRTSLQNQIQAFEGQGYLESPKHLDKHIIPVEKSVACTQRHNKQLSILYELYACSKNQNNEMVAIKSDYRQHFNSYSTTTYLDMDE